jgi:hypothetical protein
MTNKSASAELTPLANLMKIPTASSTSSLSVQSTTSSSIISIGNLNKINKFSSNINQQDSSLFNFALRPDINQDFIEKKFLMVSLEMTCFYHIKKNSFFIGISFIITNRGVSFLSFYISGLYISCYFSM